MTYHWTLTSDSLFTDGEYALGAVIGEIDEALIERVTAAEGLAVAAALDREDYDAVGRLVSAALRRANAEHNKMQARQNQGELVA